VEGSHAQVLIELINGVFSANCIWHTVCILQGREGMKMKTKLIATLLLAGSSLFAGPRVFVGLNFGAPVVPVAPVAVAYASPGPGYVWVDGFYTFVGGRRVWNAGYWRAPVFAPRYERGFVEHGFVEHRGVDRNDRRGNDRNFRR
jgi:hypothetical protein